MISRNNRHSMAPPLQILMAPLKTRTGRLAFVVTSAAAAAFMLALITVPVTVDVFCQIMPAREWLLVRNTSGGVMATVNDHAEGLIHEYAVVNVIRGDAFTFDLSSSYSPGDSLRAGDTLVTVHSFELTRTLHALSGDLAVARASLEALQTGEKQSIEEEAERELTLARERAKMLDLVAIRQDSLYRRRFVSQEQYELARSEAAAGAIGVSIAQARLDAVRTGAKPEQLRLIRSHIDELEAEIAVVKEQLATMTMIAPFAGVLRTWTGSDTLCSVESGSQVALIYVPLKDFHSVAPGRLVEIRTPSGGALLTGTVSRVDPRARMMWGTQVAFATAAVTGGTSVTPSGTLTTGSIEIERLSLLMYVQRWLNDFVVDLVHAAPGV